MDSSKKNNFPWGRFTKRGLWPLLLGLLALVGSAGLRAQTVSLGGTGALGNFINPATVTDTNGKTCNYDLLEIDLSQGKVLARPFQTSNAVGCNTTLVDITNVVDGTTGQKPFATAPTGPINDGVLEVTGFTLQQSTLVTATTPSLLDLIFVPNANNTPVWLRATGNVTINSGTRLGLYGSNGNGTNGLLRGVGAPGGPGGYRGGDGGNGGVSPSNGGSGFGPGGGPGGSGSAATCGYPASGAQYVTTGVAVTASSGPSATIPAGNDLLTTLRGGSGGGGQGGCNSSAGVGGGGGGGAILVAANNIITVNGTINAQGGQYNCCNIQMAGAGGTIRLVAATIAGGGRIDSSSQNGPAGTNGIVRLEAFTISFSGSFGGNVAAVSSPGQVVLPTGQTAFIQFASITDTASPSTNVCTIGSGSCNNAADLQNLGGRTGSIVSPDVTMPNPAGTPASTVNIVFTLGPNTTATPFPAAAFCATSTCHQLTLEVTPLDPAQGSKISYQTPAVTCPAPGGGNCSATISNVTLPLGFSSMSAFTVVNLTSGGTLARMFPNTYENEPIESVRLRTNGKETEYVLISKTGREFPYKPGSGGVATATQGIVNIPR